jgi:YD repeat-containing protein
VLALTRTVGSAPGVTATATYNALDWLTSQDDGQGTTTYGYDAAGRLRTQSLLGGAGVVTATLNAEGLATAISEAVTDTGQTRPSTSASQFTYTAADLPATDTLNSGGGPAAVSESRSYDADNRVTGLQAWGPLSTSPSLSQSYVYGYDPQGHTLTVTAPSGTQYLTYDALGRLRTATPAVGGGGSGWTFDANGNLLTGAVADSYSYSNPDGTTPRGWLPNELLSADLAGSTFSYGYDASGNTTAITASAGTTALTYDASLHAGGRGGRAPHRAFVGARGGRR